MVEIALTGALPPAPLIAFAGDSITAAAPYVTATSIGNHPYAPSSWLMPMLGQRARTDFSLNFGVAGNTSAQLLARIDAIAACPADIIVILIGTNNVNGSVSAQTLTDYKSDMAAIWDRLAAAGKVVVTMPPLPRNLSAGNQNNRRVLHAMREWMLRQAWSGRRNFYIADAAVEYGDPTSATYAPRAGYDYDGLHPQARGGYEIGAKSLFRVLDRILPPVPQFLASADDVYDATYNPGGNLLTNGLLDGTAGSKNTVQGLTPTGDIATSWQTSFSAPYSGGTALSGLTVVGSKGITADGRIEQVLTLSGGYTGDVDSAFGISQAVGSLSRIQPGDVIEAMAEIVLDVSATELPLVSPRLTMAMALPVSGNFRISDMYWVNNGYAPKEGYTLLLRTPRWTVTETPSSISFGIHMMPRQGANTFPNNAVFRIRGASLRRVIG